MKKAVIVKVERIFGRDGKCRVYYESGAVRIYAWVKAPATVKAFVKAHGYEDLTRAAVIEQAVEGKKFVVGGKAVSRSIFTNEHYQNVVKVTNCYVWLTYTETDMSLIKAKIRRDNEGNEYVIYADGCGCQRTEYKICAM